MAGFVPGGFGRNSHVPACIECRKRKAKCSKTQPCAPCARSNRKCVYTSKVSRTPLTREHLTAVENRLELLESALGKLFPTGEMQNITRDLLVEDSPAEGLSNGNNLTSDTLMFDHFLKTDGTVAPGLENSSTVIPDDHSQPVTQLHTPTVTPEEESKFIDAYFADYHTLYPILHEETCRAVQEGRIAPQPYWPVLVNMVLAFGAWLSPGAQKGIERVYFARAEEHLEKIPMGSQGNLTLIQGLVLLSEYAQKQGYPEKSGRYIGSAVQMAVALNLQMEPHDPGSSELEKELRRRVWWSVYCAESCSAKIYGRPLLLPEDALITVKPVSNIHENTLTPSSTSFPPQSDESSIYTGLIQQSSYHRLANRIYRRLLSCPDFGAEQVKEVEEMIDEWHKQSSLCQQITNPSSAPGWYLAARRRQVLCDRSLRLLIHRPLLLRWLKRKSIDGETSKPNHPAEAQCQAQGLKIARTTIHMISDLFVSGRYSKVTLSFTLYALFHALVVPLIHIKAAPSAPSSISCMQDIDKANNALQSLPTDVDALSQSFVIAINQLFVVSTHAVQGSEDSKQFKSSDGKRPLKPHDVRSSANNIFGNQELELLETGNLKSTQSLDFSEWVHS